MIKLNDLAIGYNGEAILEHIDQEFDDGLIYGILAKSGAGKTTLLKTISGLLHPVHGEVVIDGTTYGRQWQHEDGCRSRFCRCLPEP